MPINLENVKAAIDKFEDDDYVASKELLQQEIRTARDEYLQNKLIGDMDNTIEPIEEEV